MRTVTAAALTLTLAACGALPEPTQTPVHTAVETGDQPGKLVGQDGAFRFHLTKTETAAKTYGDPIPDTTSGVWVIAHVSVTNLSDNSRIFLPEFQILLWERKTYTAEPFVWNGTPATRIGPEFTHNAVLFFQIPAEPQEHSLQFEFHDSGLSQGVKLQT